MIRYLDPRNDLTFKKIFGEHPDLLISFLNALMPLEEGRRIESVEYLSSKQIPENPVTYSSIVNAMCADNRGQFIVGIQVCWSRKLMYRMAFTHTGVSVRDSLYLSNHYDLPMPLYGVGIVAAVYDHQTPEFYHHYQTVNRGNTDEVIKGLEFVMVELPKFKPEKWGDRKMAVLWLRFLKEVKDMTENVSPDLLKNDYIRKALMICEESAFSSDELAFYDTYWDHISTEKGLADVAKKEGRAEGREEGRVEDRVEGEAIGRTKEREAALERERQKNIQTVINCHQAGLPTETIAAITGLNPEEIRKIVETGL